MLTVKSGLLCVLALQELRILGIEQQMWTKQHSGSAATQLQASVRANHHQPSSVAAAAAAPSATAGQEFERSNQKTALLDDSSAPAGSAPPDEPEQEALQLSSSLLPIASEEGVTANESLLAAKQSVHINFGIMSLPALSFPGSASGGGVALSKASKAAGLRTG
jgi:hypothetical protein